MRKTRSFAEIYNDLDGEIVNLFQQLRDNGAALGELIELTPFSREEYTRSFEVSDDPLEQSRRTLVRSFMGFGSNSLCREVKSGFRSKSYRSGTTAAHDWRNLPNNFPAVIDRLRGVTIENKDAMEVSQIQDSPETLHYFDPPYIHETRTAYAGHNSRSGYNHEMSNEQHRKFLSAVVTLTGKVVISGYQHPLYDEFLPSPEWTRVERLTLADGARERTEVLWMNRPPQAELNLEF